MGMLSLGSFLATDVGCPATCWDDWIYDDSQGLDTSGNITLLGKYGDMIHLCFLYNEKGTMDNLETVKEKIIISRDNLANLINEWEEKVCKIKPSNVTIAKEGDVFTFTTSD